MKVNNIYHKNNIKPIMNKYISKNQIHNKKKSIKIYKIIIK
jgi:hypothetical protein